MNCLIYGEDMTDKKKHGKDRSTEEISHLLSEMIAPNPFFISADKVKEIRACCDLTVNELLRMLVPIAKMYARPPISNYKVGIAVLGRSGAIYLGVNLEFLGIPLNEAIHGEQFAITNARGHDETEIIAIALSAAPCGHCRQFLSELEGSRNIQILILDLDAVPLSSLLPDAFGPEDLGLTGNPLTPTGKYDFVFSTEDSPLLIKAGEAAFASYAPYTESKSGVAIRLKSGKIYSGSYLENAAFNPSISPLQAALISLVANREEYSEMSEVILIEKQSAKISQETMSREILKKIAPKAIFNVKKLDF